MNILNSLIRIGTVSSVDPETATVRVVFQSPDVVSYDLPVLQRQTLRNKDYWLPDVGEVVVCIFLPTSGNAVGFVLGAIYSKEDQPPLNSQDERAVFFEDGTCIKYNRASHTLTINAVGPVNIVAAGNINVSGDVISDGISLKNHVHQENDIGGLTGKPQ